MTGVFINYRTDDGGQAAGLLDRRLREEFGDDLVFLDSTALAPGINFPQETLRRLDLSTVLLVVIGPGWLDARDAHGRRRLEDPDDFLRREIEISLERRIHVIPVVLQGAELPKRHELPESIGELAERQKMSLRSRGYDSDLQLIVDKLISHLPRPERSAPTQSATVHIEGDRNQFGPITGGIFHGR